MEKTESIRAVSHVLNEVIHDYYFTSLAELNAVLRLYNLVADAGAEGSRLQKNSGLVYRILDREGQPTGVPIKASSIAFGPTLTYLVKQFESGARNRERYSQKLKTAIDFRLYQKPKDLAHFIAQMQGEKVTVVPRQNKEGFVFGLTFIDHRTKCVFNGSDLGKSYSAAGIQKRITTGGKKSASHDPVLLQKKSRELPTGGKINAADPFTNNFVMDRKPQDAGPVQTANDWLHQLLKAEKEGGNLPYEFRKKNKKKWNNKR